MRDTQPQTAAGKVLMHFTMSLDGFVAGPGHSMDWLAAETTNRPGLVEEYVETTGAVLGGRAGWDLDHHARPYSDEWQGSILVLTRHPEDAPDVDGVTVLSCDVAEAVRIGLEAAGGKNLAVLSPTIGRQLLELGLVDELDVHIAPVLLGDGIRLFDHPRGQPISLRLENGDNPSAEINLRYQPR